MEQDRKLGYAWILICAALATHVADEALTGFLAVYNPTVLALRREIPWFPMPVFDFGVWLAGLVTATALLASLSHFCLPICDGSDPSPTRLRS